MPDREKVIKGLEHCEFGVYATCYEKKCPYYQIHDCTDELCIDELKNDILALLKEQAKVLTVDELEDALDTVVWLETPASENCADGYSLIMAYSHKHGYMFFDSPFGDNPSQDRLEYSEYGRTWRCWDRRPLEEQRKAVMWDEVD